MTRVLAGEVLLAKGTSGYFVLLTGAVVVSLLLFLVVGRVGSARRGKRMPALMLDQGATWASMTRVREGEYLLLTPGGRTVLGGARGMLFANDTDLWWQPLSYERRRGSADKRWNLGLVVVVEESPSWDPSGVPVRSLRLQIPGGCLRLQIFLERGTRPHSLEVPAA